MSTTIQTYKPQPAVKAFDVPLRHCATIFTGENRSGMTWAAAGALRELAIKAPDGQFLVAGPGEDHLLSAVFPAFQRVFLDLIASVFRHEDVPCSATLTNGAKIYFQSTRRAPMAAGQWDAVWLDCEATFEHWWAEIAPKLIRRQGAIIWSTTKFGRAAIPLPTRILYLRRCDLVDWLGEHDETVIRR